MAFAFSYLSIVGQSQQLVNRPSYDPNRPNTKPGNDLNTWKPVYETNNFRPVNLQQSAQNTPNTPQPVNTAVTQSMSADLLQMHTLLHRVMQAQDMGVDRGQTKYRWRRKHIFVKYALKKLFQMKSKSSKKIDMNKTQLCSMQNLNYN